MSQHTTHHHMEDVIHEVEEVIHDVYEGLSEEELISHSHHKTAEHYILILRNVAVALAESEGIRNQVKILVGGAPITQEFCDEIGADAYTDDAAQAARVAVAMLSQ